MRSDVQSELVSIKSRVRVSGQFDPVAVEHVIMELVHNMNTININEWYRARERCGEYNHWRPHCFKLFVHDGGVDVNNVVVSGSGATTTSDSRTVDPGRYICMAANDCYQSVVGLQDVMGMEHAANVRTFYHGGKASWKYTPASKFTEGIYSADMSMFELQTPPAKTPAGFFNSNLTAPTAAFVNAPGGTSLRLNNYVLPANHNPGSSIITNVAVWNVTMWYYYVIECMGRRQIFT